MVRFLLGNFGVVLVIALLVLGYNLWQSDESIVYRELPVRFPDEPVTGSAGDLVRSDWLELKVVAVDRAPSREVAADVLLSSRARVDAVTDFLIVELEATNTGDRQNVLDYDGSNQNADFRLGWREPVPGTALPLLPEDVERLAGLTPLPSGLLPGASSVKGNLVFPVNRNYRDLTLVQIPAGSRVASEEPAERSNLVPSVLIELDG